SKAFHGAPPSLLKNSTRRSGGWKARIRRRTERDFVFPHVGSWPDCVAKVFFAFGRETLIQDRARTSNNDSKEPTLRFDCYKFLFHRACLATFATQSATKRTYQSCRSMSAFGE